MRSSWVEKFPYLALGYLVWESPNGQRNYHSGLADYPVWLLIVCSHNMPPTWNMQCV